MAADRAVLITGASSGIGRDTALYLAERGFRVFAGVRRESDADRLRSDHPAITPVQLDVTRPEDIRSAVRSVGEAVGSTGVYGLLNNAGIATGGPIEFVPTDDLRAVLEVNLVGAYAATQAFIPLIRAARGRIVNMGSISGRVAAAMMSPYSISKFGLGAFSDCLRRELKPWGIEVALIEPGAVKTAIWDKAEDTAQELTERLGPDAVALYAPMVAAVTAWVQRAARKAVPTERVASVVHHALTARRPRTRYVVGRDARIGARMAGLLPDRMMDRFLTRPV